MPTKRALHWATGSLFNLHMLKVDKDRGKRIPETNRRDAKYAIEILRFHKHDALPIFEEHYKMVWDS